MFELQATNKITKHVSYALNVYGVLPEAWVSASVMGTL